MDSLLEIVDTHYDEDDEMPNIFTHSPYYTNEQAISLLSNKKDVFSIMSIKLSINICKN